MAEMLINELVRASGVPSSALRYYERVGLMAPVGRSSGGYRMYDDRAVERLAFIGRAKRLGLSLDEISDLVELWEDGACAPVQSRLQTLLDDKVAGLDAQIGELVRFRSQLGHVQRCVASAESADRCGPGCGCDTELTDVNEVPIAFGRSPFPAAEEAEAEIVCTLPQTEWTERLAEWQAMFDVVEERRATPEGIALRFPKDAETLASLARVATLEVGCCSFLSFTLTLGANGAWLAVSAPPSARSLVDELFGPADD